MSASDIAVSVGVFVPLAALAVTAWQARADYALRARTDQVKADIDLTRTFLDVLAVAHSRSRETGVGLAETLAAVQLIGDLGLRHDQLKPSAITALQAFIDMDDGRSATAAAVLKQLR